jgi:GTPase SAR1 family protein
MPPWVRKWEFGKEAPDASPIAQRGWLTALLHDVSVAISGLLIPKSPILQLFSTGDGGRDVKILISGLDYSGKSTILHHIVGEHRSNEIDTRIGYPAMGICTEDFKLGGSDQGHGGVRILALCLGGGRPDTLLHFEEEIVAGCDAMVWMVDSVNRERLVESVEEFELALGWKVGASNGGRDGSRLPVLILPNRQDKEEALTVDEVRDSFRDALEKHGEQVSWVGDDVSYHMA